MQINNFKAVLAACGLIGQFSITGCDDSDPRVIAQVQEGIPSSSESPGVPGRSIEGRVWNDADGSGQLEVGERLQEGVVIYIDTNDNGQRDEGELFTTTNSIGEYTFANLTEGEYLVRQEVPFGWRNISGGETSGLNTANVVNSRNDFPMTYIFGGTEADDREYPFLVKTELVFTSTITGETRAFTNCGGSLITDQWVVTAAHCSVDPVEYPVGYSEGPARVVVVGTNSINNDGGQRVGVSKVILHPSYQENGELGHDIALWKLDSPVHLKAGHVETISMIASDEPVVMDHAGVLATAVGWGVYDGPNGEEIVAAERVRETHVPIIEPEACLSQYREAAGAGANIRNLDSMLCASVPEGGIGICNGDSGSPLVVRDLFTEKWRMAGVSSWVRGRCGFTGTINAFARLSYLSGWVMQTAQTSSRVHRINVTAGHTMAANFGNQSSRYESSRPIEPRWQLTNIQAGTHPVNGTNVIRWNIIDEADEAREMTCTYEDGSMGPIELSCGRDTDNLIELSYPEEAGIYILNPRLTARLGDTRFTRTATTVVTNEPLPEFSIEGEIDPTSDPLDPDLENEPPPAPGWPAAPDRWMDHYRVSGLSYEKPVLLRLEWEEGSVPEDVNLDLLLFDGDVRRASGFGGDLYPFERRYDETSATLLFIPSPDINEYLVGIRSTQGISYSLTIQNEGTVEATTLPPPVGETNARSLKE